MPNSKDFDLGYDFCKYSTSCRKSHNEIISEFSNKYQPLIKDKQEFIRGLEAYQLEFFFPKEVAAQ